MEKYKLIISQEAGCDYTIKCGLNVIDILANNIVDALKESKEIIVENYSGKENRLKSAELVEIQQSLILNVEDIYNEKIEAEKRKQLIQVNAAEYAEFLRLKNKFETK